MQNVVKSEIKVIQQNVNKYLTLNCVKYYIMYGLKWPRDG